MMDKNMFFEILECEISGLPIDEQKNAIDFYKEYFNECETDDIAIAKLDHPITIAQNLYDGLGVAYAKHKNNKQEEKYEGTKNNNVEDDGENSNIFKKAFSIFMAFMLFPFIFSFVITMFSFFVIVPASFTFCFGTLFVSAIYAIIPAFFHNFPTGLVFMGFILLGIGLTILFSKLTALGYNTSKDICKKLLGMFNI